MTPEQAVTNPDWLDRIIAEFRGRDPGPSLSWMLPDGFAMPAVRGPEDRAGMPPPVAMRPPGKPWEIIGRVAVSGDSDHEVRQALDAGADGVLLTVPDGADSEVDPESFRSVVLDPAVRLVDPGPAALDVLHDLANRDVDHPVSILFDPCALYLRSGSSVTGEAFDAVAEALLDRPGAALRILCADGLCAHEAGATDALEAAVVLASVAQWFAQLTHERGVPVDRVARALSVTASAGPLFFSTIARLRALRLGIVQVAGAFGASGDAALSIPVHASTSARQQSHLDIHGNLLRATTSAAAAVIGGCDSLLVEPHDAPLGLSAAGLRLSLSLQVMLRDEGHLHHVSDPSAGSWYVEDLTARMGEAAWQNFLAIQREGGLAAALETGSLVDRIREQARAQERALDRREAIMVGVNRYSDPAEPHPDGGLHPLSGSGPIEFRRPSERIESLRAALHPNTREEHAVALLLAVGTPGVAAQRARFAADFLGTAGLTVEGPRSCASTNDVLAEVRQIRIPLVVLCARDEDYTAVGPRARAELDRTAPDVTLVAVGRPPDGEPSRWSVDVTIDPATPLLAGLSAILTAAGLRTEEA